MKTGFIKSVIHWVEPPKPGQPLEELEWVWLDLYEGKAVVAEEPPTPEEIAQVIVELKPYFRVGKEESS